MIGIATPLIGHQVYKKDKCIKMEWWRQGLVLPKKSPSAAKLEKKISIQNFHYFTLQMLMEPFLANTITLPPPSLEYHGKINFDFIYILERLDNR